MTVWCTPVWTYPKFHILIGGLEHVLFVHLLGIVIPTDELIFFRGVGQPPTSILLVTSPIKDCREMANGSISAWWFQTCLILSSERGPRFLIVGRKRVSAYDLWQCPCYRFWPKKDVFVFPQCLSYFSQGMTQSPTRLLSHSRSQCPYMFDG